MKSTGKKDLIIFSVISCVVVLDQLAKLFVKSLNVKLAVIKDIFNISYTTNYGAGFGILQNQRWLFILFGTIVLGLIVYYYNKIPRERYVQIFFALVTGGAIGNLIDRIVHGYVIDFISFAFWPSFNIADMAISVGAIGLIVYYWKK